jgi:hypothetical protein
MIEGFRDQSQLLVTNLIQNAPQKLLNIAPYTLLSFVDTGPMTEFSFSDIKDHKTNLVYLLAKKDGKIFLF